MADVASLMDERSSNESFGEPEQTQPAREIFRIAGHQLSLVSDRSVFRPTLTTSLLTEAVLADGLARGKALDLGCGLGPIAIALAKSGADHVWAIDLMASACELARLNAQINGVGDCISVLEGDLFEPVAGSTFDLIVDDVSGVAAEVARLSRWFPDKVPLGGEDGSTLTVRMLKSVKRFLRTHGRLYFPVLSLSNRGRILNAAEDVFGADLHCVARKQVPFSPELKEHLVLLLDMRERGLIGFEQIRSRCFWTLEIYRGIRVA